MLLLVLVAVASTGAVPRRADAASNGTWQVLPTQREPLQRSRVFFVYELAPGAVLHDAVTLSNLTGHPISFRLYATDAVNAAGNGAWALRPSGAPAAGVGSWFTLGATTATVPGQGRVDVPFELRVPADASPGDHAGGVVAANTVPDAAIARGGTTVAVVREVGVRVYLRVAGGTTPAVRISGLRVGRDTPLIPYVTGHVRLTVRYRVRNVGNVRLAASARLRVTDVTGRTVKRFPPVRVDDLLPGADIPITVAWPSAPPLGRLTAHVDLDGRVTSASAASAVWVVPWFATALAAALLVGAVRIVVVLRRRPARDRAPAARATGRSGDGGDAT